MNDLTDRLLGEFPGTKLSSETLSALSLEDDVIGALEDGAFIDKLGNIWVDRNSLNRILPSEYLELSLSHRYVNLLRKGKCDYFRGPLVMELIDSAIENSKSKDQKRKAKSFRQAYQSIQDSDQFSKMTTSDEAELLKEKVSQLIGLLSNKGDEEMVRGLTSHMLDILLLVEEKSRKMKSLDQSLDTPTLVGITIQVDRLSTLGFVRREKQDDPNDPLITITDTGRQRARSLLDNIMSGSRVASALRRFGMQLRDRKLSEQGYHILGNACDRPYRMREFLDLFGYSPVPLTKSIVSLVGHEFVNREERDDPRNPLITITSKGRDTVESLRKDLETIANSCSNSDQRKQNEVSLALKLVIEWSTLC